MAPDGGVYPPKRMASAGIILTATISCLVSLAFLLWGLIIEGPAFYNGQECTMTYSRFQFLPLHVPSHPPNNRYRLLKFTDGRDPRHQHFYPISGSLVEDYQTQNTKKSNQNNNGRLLEFHDNWCLLPRREIDKNASHIEWSDAPHPHRGHPVLYVPGHWGSFSQARSLGAHGTRWTGPYHDASTHQKIFESLRSGRGMHDGTQLLRNMENSTDDIELIMDLLSSTQYYQDGFVMDIYAIDFGEEGAALHSSKILNQADFVARAIETLVEGCHLGDSETGITMVAHSIGAWAVRASLDMNPHLISKGWVQNVINLASPLQSIPYAVDSGVHDLVQTLNERDISDAKQNVAVISVSGGLRDELIPPALGRGQSGSSDSFLANSILEAKSTTEFGMDHRCIVWCYDLLTQIRGVIFMLALTTDRGMGPSERMNIVRRILHQTNHAPKFEDKVKTLHESALDAKGYSALVSVQLAAPYYLNCLLKLCILVGLAHSLLLRPLFLQHQRQRYGQQHGSIYTTCMEVSISLLLLPSIVTISSLIRRLELQFLGWNLRQCYMHECEMLLGTIFVLTQLAALIYFIIVYGVGFVIDKISRRFCTSSQEQLPFGTFGTTLCSCSVKSLRLYPTTCLPLTIAVFVVARGTNVMFDSTALAPTFFVSLAILILGCLLKLIFKPTATNLAERRMTFVILLISLVKATYGKLIYAYSMMQRVGSDNRCCSNEMLACFTSSLLPAFLAIMAVETHDEMTQNALLEWKRRTKGDKGDTGVGICLNKTETPGVFLVINTFLIIWYMWNVLVNYSGDDIVVPLYSVITVVMAYWNCYPLSADAINLYAAIIDDDLSFHCEFKDKDE
eukprot:scaffold1014_cov142-Skeletonema_dohrnii-CCMP3373.AAC.5